MSIISKNHYQTGGNVVSYGQPSTVPGGALPGQQAQQAVESQLYNSGDNQFAFSSDIDEQTQNYADWLTNPANVPQYYTGSTVAGTGPTLDLAHQRYSDVAGQTDTITNQLAADYQSQLDPNSALNQQYAQNAANRAGSTFYGAGTPGSARGQYASQVAAQDVYRDRRDNALRGLGEQRGHLSAGADLLRGVGIDQRDIAQDVIDEDIKRFNYAQLTPATIQEQLLSTAALSEGADVSATNPWNKVLASPSSSGSLTFDDLFKNEGGEVHGIMSNPNMTSSVSVAEVDMGDPLSLIEEAIKGIAMASDFDIEVKRKTKRGK